MLQTAHWYLCISTVLLFAVGRINSFSRSSIEGKQIFHSPVNKVPIANLMLTFMDGREITLDCSNHQIEPIDVIQGIDWPLTGLKRMSDGLVVYANKLLSESAHNRVYRANIDRYGMSLFNYTMQCVSQAVIDADKNVQNAYCDCVSELKPSEMCELIDTLHPTLLCLDSFSAAVNVTSHCNRIDRHFFRNKPAYSKRCSGLSTLNVLAEDFLLSPFKGLVYHHPSVIDSSTIENEFRTYYQASKAIENLKYWTDAHLFCESRFNESTLDDIPELLPHYKPIMYFYNLSPHLERAPIAILAQRHNTLTPESAFADMNLLLVIRDARTTDEAALASIYRLGPPSSSLDEGRVHVGYNVLAAQLFDEIDNYFSRIHQNKTFDNLKFTVTGEGSLGAGAGAILVSLISKKYPATGNNIASYSLVSFDAPMVGDAAFTRGLSERVNVRNIISKNEGMVAQHCDLFPGCDRTHFIETGRSNEVFRGYVPLPGRVVYDISKESELDPMWSSPKHMFELAANTLSCGAQCWLKTKYCKDDPTNKCIPGPMNCASTRYLNPLMLSP